MNIFTTFNGANSESIPERSARVLAGNGQRHRVIILGALLLAVGAHDLRAQVGSNNPTGVSGIFNGNITTGCSYDPYTGNATRSITDIAVAGAVGQYPLAFVRTYNSRSGGGGVGGFGAQWAHNYGWQIEATAPQSHPFSPSSYTVDYPDGRKVTFAPATGDPYYRGPLGVRERFIPLGVNNYCYLLLPDGGKVEFYGEEYDSGGDGAEIWWWVYTATAMIDPHGIRTTFSYNGDGTLYRVTDASNQRYLQFDYNTGLISSISSSDGRSVQYNYTTISPGGQPYVALTSVVYYGNNNWTAHYTYQAPNVPPTSGIPLLRTCDDPMYSGPMQKIGYTYRTADNYTGNHAVYGQTSSENYYDGTTVRFAVSTLTVPSATNRTETRADGKTRTFIYTAAGYLTSCTDFMSHSASQGYDSNKWINSVTDRNNHTTNYTHEPLTGNVTQIQFPATADATPSPTLRGTINYTYGASGCADPNNRDSNNPYFVCTATDEGGHVTQFWRDTNKRVTRIDYPDGGYETFSYDVTHFYQLSTHRMKTGGTETFSYDTRHRLQYYSDPYHSNPGNPSIQYSYDSLDRLTGVTDALSHTTNFDYNNRGQVTLTTLPSYNGTRYTITNFYNPDGTLQYRKDELNHRTDYTYDDYRRLKSVTPPVRGSGDNGTYTTNYYYGANPWDGLADYNYTDSNVTFVVLPSGKKTKTVYDDDRRTSTVTAGYGTSAAATITYVYDNAGNLTQVKNPRNNATSIGVDERNRPSSITEPINGMTSFMYDNSGRKKLITRPNGQVITYVSFDAMNRVTQQNATQTPTGLAITKFAYYTTADGANAPVGLLKTMQDPHLSSGSDNYLYEYDLMGRKKKVTYPQDSTGSHYNEQWIYDAEGRLYQFINRGGKTQTFTYDQLDRVSGFTWNDGTTPGVTFGYDAASRLTNINNANANITRAYYNDGLLHSETESILLTGGYSKTVTYAHDSDGNRASTTYPTPESYAFGYAYTARNQLQSVNGWATYNYDENTYTGDLTSRVLTATQNSSTYSYDTLDRVTWLTHTLTNASRGFNYGYQSNTNNWKYVRRTGGTLGNVGDVFNYGLADQATGVELNVPSPATTPTPAPNIAYDSNGNRTSFHPPYVSWETYGAANNLSQYTTRTISGNPQTTAAYDNKGNLTSGLDSSTYVYDAQNRLTSAAKSGGMTMYFTYDGLNRQVSHKIGVNGTLTFNVWDGWNLIEEYQAAGNGATTAAYLYGAGELISGVTNGQFAYYFQDASGSTSHLTDVNGNLLEWYRYDLQGAPIFYNASDQQLSASAYGVCYLFTGQQWRSELGLYDLRNRFYSPDIGRFLQPDPIDFDGDPTNLYRYVGNNPVNFADPSGLWTLQLGLSGTIQAGPLTVSISFGIAFDGHANFGWYTQPLGGVGVGGDANAGVAFFGSNADTIYGLGGPFTHVGGELGVAGDVQGEVFHGRDAVNGKIVSGFGVVLGVGGGGGVYGGISYTNIYPLLGSQIDAGPPDHDPNRIIVYGPPIYESSSPGGPTWGNGVGIFDTTGFNAQYTPNFYGYTGSLPTTLANPFGSWGPSHGGPIGNWIGPGGQIIPTSIFGPNNFYSGLDPISAFPGIYGSNPVGAMEPAECFVSGTPILMADGSEKPIENIQVGEAVLAWNEETKKVFPSKVISAIHHDARLETLFDIELEDGRKFTVNNTHPMYTIEYGDFKFTDDLASRFAKGDSVTFQDNNERAVKVTALRMRREICKMYNLHVEGQGKNGHTYYANGILVHNSGAGFRRK